MMFLLLNINQDGSVVDAALEAGNLAKTPITTNIFSFGVLSLRCCLENFPKLVIVFYPGYSSHPILLE